MPKPFEPAPGPERVFAPRVIATFNEHVKPARWVRRLPRRRAWTLWLTREGRTRYVTNDGRALDLDPGEVVLTHPGCPGRMQVPPGARARSLTFDVVYRELEPAVFGWQPVSGAPRMPTPRELWNVDLPLRLPKRLVNNGALLVIEACDRWWLRGSDADLVDLRLAAWLAELARPRVQWEIDQQADQADQNPITKAEAQARRTYRSGCTTADMAAAAGLSRAQFAKRYQLSRQEGPGEFLRRLRLDEARRLLSQTDIPVSDVARKSGYRSSPTFARAFRAAEGLAPAAWRLHHRG